MKVYRVSSRYDDGTKPQYFRRRDSAERFMREIYHETLLLRKQNQKDFPYDDFISHILIEEVDVEW